MWSSSAFRAPLAVLLLCGPALAQCEYCADANGNVDANATQAWAQMQERADGAFMEQLAGTWYSQTQSPATGQTAETYVTYAPDGRYQYQQRICSATGCNDYGGGGSWAAFPMGGGAYTIMTITTDQSRSQQCYGTTSRMVDANTVVDNLGTVSRRTQ